MGLKVPNNRPDSNINFYSKCVSYIKEIQIVDKTYYSLEEFFLVKCKNFCIK